MTILVKNSIPPNIPMGDEEVAKLKVSDACIDHLKPYFYNCMFPETMTSIY